MTNARKSRDNAREKLEQVRAQQAAAARRRTTLIVASVVVAVLVVGGGITAIVLHNNKPGGEPVRRAELLRADPQPRDRHGELRADPAGRR